MLQDDARNAFGGFLYFDLVLWDLLKIRSANLGSLVALEEMLRMISFAR